jgi:hypothetical protein
MNRADLAEILGSIVFLSFLMALTFLIFVF